MRFKGFDGKEYPVNTQDYRVFGDDKIERSSLHLKARALLREIFPCTMILEEVSLPGSRKSGRILYADFLIPTKFLMVEVHGEQHYKYNSFFYSNKLEFAAAKKRDADKQEWCEINSLKLIELPYSESVDEWRTRLCGPTTRKNSIETRTVI